MSVHAFKLIQNYPCHCLYTVLAAAIFFKLFSFILIKVLHISKLNITFISDYNTKK